MSNMIKIPKKNSIWLQSDGLQKLFEILQGDGEEVRVNGGAVRNSLLGEEIGDVDLSTTLVPERVLERLKKAGVKAIATGLEHGTVTAVIDKTGYEITTLRKDIKTDGRHAVVEFGRDWKEDAKRRDLTMNALYCDAAGNVFDPLEGYEDLMARNVRFIGRASERIEEDYLRILRFFRFFAQYGKGRPDGEGLKACAKLKSGISELSAERIWAEFGKILTVGDPSRALLWMRTTGVLTTALPESEKWGIDFLGDLIGAENDLSWSADKMVRLQVIVPPVADTMAQLSKRLRFSNKQAARMREWAKSGVPAENTSETNMAKLLYRGTQLGICDRLRCEVVRQRHIAVEQDGALEKAAKFTRLLNFAEQWARPLFVLKGRDLEAAGMEAGPEMGQALKRLEELWVDSDFAMSKSQLLAKL